MLSAMGDGFERDFRGRDRSGRFYVIHGDKRKE